MGPSAESRNSSPEEGAGLPYINSAEKTTDTHTGPDGSVADEQVFQYDDSRKLGIVSSVFLILNKMIGTGSKL